MKNTTIMGAALAACIFGSVSLGTDTSVPHLRADDVHAMGIDGFGVTVAIIDTGIDSSHPGLAGHIHGAGASFIGGVLQLDPGDDLWGFDHGTYMSLIVTDNSGVAPGADILPIGVFGPLGGAAVTDVVLGIQYVTALRNADPSIRVINLSLGGGEYECPCNQDSAVTRLYQLAIQDALNAGIITFAASGNEVLCGWINRPACVTAATIVAATYDADYDVPVDYGDCADPWPPEHYVSCFSNVADDCDHFMAAPGVDIVLWEGTSWEFWGDGTSQATAHASGVAALMFDKAGCADLSGAAARALIESVALEIWFAWPFCDLPPEPMQFDAVALVNATSSGTSTPGDLDCDGRVSNSDLDTFTGCMTGPGGGPVQGHCLGGDFPSSPPDGDIDLRDFAGFQIAFTGPGSGACCHNDASCTIETAEDCVDEWGATYHGHDTTCAGVQCALPDHGACCLVDGTGCFEDIQINCAFNGGMYQGDGSLCSSTPCPTVRYRNVVDPLYYYQYSGAGRMLGDQITLEGSGGGQMTYYDLAVLGGTGDGGVFDVTVGLYNYAPCDGGVLIPNTERTFVNVPDNGSPVFLSATFDPPVSIPHQFWMVANFSDGNAGWFNAYQAEVGFTDDVFLIDDGPCDCYCWYGGDPWAGFWANIGVSDDP